MYCFDANSFIEPWNALYPEDTFPSFWSKLDALIAKGLVVAPDEVGKEIEAGQDDLSKWVKARKKMFRAPDAAVQAAVAVLVNKYPIVNTKKQKSNGDPWVIALAQCANLTVVTQEKSAPQAKFMKIPDVCSQLKVPCINVLAMIRREKWSF